ncbi:hypothetical protein Acr_13g0012470 [Actinidia rufa]|uniref:Retrovirus-related Pol polyprotein from transposon TNT 1-94-like beta-barrel domain-containing protein n=1 Tax=Actinidia rufa TaxID=165716 RepID=A0A7J0FPH7_9ERIC|nr:hypothetical protein Acr_13g0012470 [Actinidia rufa]
MKLQHQTASKSDARQASTRRLKFGASDLLSDTLPTRSGGRRRVSSTLHAPTCVRREQGASVEDDKRKSLGARITLSTADYAMWKPRMKDIEKDEPEDDWVDQTVHWTRGVPSFGGDVSGEDSSKQSLNDEEACVEVSETDYSGGTYERVTKKRSGNRRGKRNCPRYKVHDQSSGAATIAVMAVDKSDVLLAASVDGKSDWILDSGNAYHLCRDKEMCSTYAACEGLVWVANNTSNRVVGKGKVRFRMTDGRVMMKESEKGCARKGRGWRAVFAEGEREEGCSFCQQMRESNMVVLSSSIVKNGGFHFLYIRLCPKAEEGGVQRCKGLGVTRDTQQSVVCRGAGSCVGAWRVEDIRLLPPERVGRMSESRSDVPNFRRPVEACPASVFDTEKRENDFPRKGRSQDAAAGGLQEIARGCTEQHGAAWSNKWLQGQQGAETSGASKVAAAGRSGGSGLRTSFGSDTNKEQQGAETPGHNIPATAEPPSAAEVEEAEPLTKSNLALIPS